MFKNAKIVFVRYNIIRNINRAVYRIRIDTMNSCSKYSLEYKTLKKYWKFILKNDDDIESEEIRYFVHFKAHQIVYEVLQFMLKTSDELNPVYHFQQFFKMKAKSNKIKEFLEDIKDTTNYPIRLVFIIIQIRLH